MESAEPRIAKATSTVLLASSVGIFALGALLDIYTTSAIFTTPGIREANPFVSVIIKTGGTTLFVGLKLIIGVLTYLLFWRLGTKWYLVVAFSTLGGLWFTAGVWNSYLLLSLT
jgi:hypothetical protein